MDAFVAGYVNAAITLLSDDRSSDQSLQVYNVSDLAPETLLRIQQDCEEFQVKAGETLTIAIVSVGYSAERAGNDFWLTRNGHGAGFWDRNELPGGVGEQLTILSKQFDYVELYVGDDNKLYLE